jgi:hypothetical protein
MPFAGVGGSDPKRTLGSIATVIAVRAALLVSEEIAGIEKLHVGSVIQSHLDDVPCLESQFAMKEIHERASLWTRGTFDPPKPIVSCLLLSGNGKKEGDGAS